MPCHGLAGAYQHCDVNIGWYPYRVKAGRTPKVLSQPGNPSRVLAELRPLDGIALQSVRNPTCSSTPPRRKAVWHLGRRYVWGYKRYGAITGWIAWADVEPDPDYASKRECTGPAKLDFEVGRGTATRGQRSGCGYLSVEQPPLIVVAHEAHLRYSPHGTSYWYLHQGDVVRVLLSNGPQGNHFVEVVSGSVRRGTRGWASIAALSRQPVAGVAR